MLNAIKQFFTLPVFPANETKTRLTRTLYTLMTTLLIAMALALIMAVPFIYVQKWLAIIILLTMLGLLIIVNICARCGYLRIASLLYIFMLWGLATIVLYLGTGTSSQATCLYMSITVMAGVLLSARWAVVLAIISSLVVLGSALLEMNGYLFPHIFPEPPLTRWFDFSIILIFTITPIGLIVTSLSEILAGAKLEIAHRKEAELLLQQSNARICHLNDVLRAVRDVGSLINREKDPTELLNAVCNSLVQTRGYVMVWIGKPEADSKRVLPAAHSGADRYFMQHAPITWDDSPTGQGPAGTAMRERRAVVFSDLANDPRFALWKGPVMTDGGASIASIPLIHKERLLGVLTVKADRPHAFDPEEVELLSNLAADLARALQSLENEAALRESEVLYRTLVNLSPDAISVADMNGLLTFKSPKARQMFEDSPGEEVLGGSLLRWVAPEDYEKVSSSIRRLLTEGVGTATEYTLLKNDGTRFIGEINAAVINSPDGSPMRMIAIIRDVTERKRAEDTLRESEERFSRFFRASPIGAGILRLTDSKFADVNDVLLGLFGYTREEIIGQTPLDLEIWANPEDRAKMVEILQRQGRVKDFETRFRFKSGEIGDALFSAEVIEAAGQQYILSLIYDITERKRGEKERKKLEDQLFQAQKMESIGRLAGGVAHDFNNMLGVIIGRAEMALQQHVPTDKLRRNLEEILKAGLRSAELTRQLLAFARIQIADPKILDLNGTISSMLKMLRRLIGEDIDLLWIPELDLWKVKVDPSQVDQILANLAVNSRDAISGAGAITMRTGNVVIDESIRAETPEFIPGEYVLLTVSDTGAGMSKEVCENIFEPFFTTKEVGKGTGLGLSTVYGIVKQNDGFVYAASEPGKGTTFKIYLPRFKAETAQVPSKQAAGKVPTGTETILLVEDDETILNLSKMILENLGYTVLAESAPEHAINVVEDHPGDIHLLITDVVMPGMNGRELAEQLGAIRPNLKRLYMSGYTADLIAHRGILDEGVNFIQKPFRSDELAAKVRQVLDHLE